MIDVVLLVLKIGILIALYLFVWRRRAWLLQPQCFCAWHVN